MFKNIRGRRMWTPRGTTAFMAREAMAIPKIVPEAILKKTYKEKADMWSLGCIMYEIVIGVAPFYTTKEIIRGEFDLSSPWGDENVSDQAKDLIACLLTVDSKKRYGLDDVLHHPWSYGGH